MTQGPKPEVSSMLTETKTVQVSALVLRMNPDQRTCQEQRVTEARVRHHHNWSKVFMELGYNRQMVDGSYCDLPHKITHLIFRTH